MSGISEHKFVPGYTGMTCDHMYMNSLDDPAQCGLPGDHPLHVDKVATPKAETICTHCGELAGYSPSCGYCFDPAKYEDALRQLRDRGITGKFHSTQCLENEPAPCICGTDAINLNNIKENIMPQRVEDIEQLPLHAEATAKLEKDRITRELIDGRVALYGEPVEGFKRIAQVWSGILGTEVSATDVCLCMIGMKAVRANVTPDYSDNIDDIAGYRDIYLQIMGDDMIRARTGAEYWEEMERRG